MQGSKVAWEDLSAEDQGQKLTAIAKLLKENGLAKIKPKVLDQVIYQIKAGVTRRQKALIVEGSVSGSEAENVKSFKKAARESVLANVSEQTANIDIQVKLGVGAKFNTIEGVTDIYTGAEKSIEHKAGQVILIDFWATWCPPCQKPMGHNQEMLEEHGERWGDKVRLIGISIDQTAQAVVKHVEAKGWKKVEHYHKAGSSCDEDFGVQGVPHIAIVDTNGKIAFVGHPASISLPEGIEKLLKGQSLGGAGGEDGEEGEDGEYKNLEIPKITAEMDNFQAKTAQLGENGTLKDLAKGLQRDFVVLIRQSKIDPETEVVTTSYQNINVLVGVSASVDGAKAEIEKFVGGFGGSFNTDWKIQKF